jgi:hypothetical protein
MISVVLVSWRELSPQTDRAQKKDEREEILIGRVRCLVCNRPSDTMPAMAPATNSFPDNFVRSARCEEHFRFFLTAPNAVPACASSDIVLAFTTRVQPGPRGQY